MRTKKRGRGNGEEIKRGVLAGVINGRSSRVNDCVICIGNVFLNFMLSLQDAGTAQQAIVNIDINVLLRGNSRR